MYDNLKRRRIDLLWQGVRLAGQAGYADLSADAARASGYQEAFGEGKYMEVLVFDIDQLLKDGAVEVDRGHRMYGVGDFTPYRLTPEGRQILLDTGYSI